MGIVLMFLTLSLYRRLRPRCLCIVPCRNISTLKWCNFLMCCFCLLTPHDLVPKEHNEPLRLKLSSLSGMEWALVDSSNNHHSVNLLPTFTCRTETPHITKFLNVAFLTCPHITVLSNAFKKCTYDATRCKDKGTCNCIAAGASACILCGAGSYKLAYGIIWNTCRGSCCK